MADDRRVIPMFPDRNAAVSEMQIELERLKRGGGDGTSGGVTEDWKTSVDRQLTQLHGDVRGLLYGLIGGFVFLIGAGAAAYTNLAGQLSDGRKEVGAVQVEQAKINAKLDLLLERTAPK